MKAPARPRRSTLPRGWCAYLLRCRDGSLYAGATNDIAARLARHAAGKGARYTRSRLPVELAYVVRAKDRGAALRREAALKRLSRAEKLALVASRPAPAYPASARETISRASATMAARCASSRKLSA